MDQCACVVTVPLDYSQEQRNVIMNCAIKAGFKVAQVISEPAAAIPYKYNHKSGFGLWRTILS